MKKIDKLRKEWVARQEELNLPLDYSLPMPIFEFEATSKRSQKSGLGMEEKIRREVQTITKPSSSGEEGDGLFNGQIVEIKASIQIHGKYNLDRIRPFQDVKYFVLFLMNEKGFSFYIVVTKETLFSLKSSALNGNKKRNAENTYVETKFTLGEKQFQFLLDNNLLESPDFKSLLKFFNAPQVPKKMNRNVSYKIDGKCISGVYKQYVLRNFVEYITPEMATKIISPFHLSKSPSKHRNVKINEYYLDPRISNVYRQRMAKKWNQIYPNRTLEIL